MDKKIINIPDAKVSRTPHTAKELESESKKRLSHIIQEFRDGFNFIKNYPKSVSIFGSARFDENSAHYAKARELGRKLAEAGFAVVTGGGPGIMEGANRGAYESGGQSVGLTIELPDEQITNPYVTSHIGFHYFFARKVALSFAAEAYVFFPGGFGTLDEFFELITLIQTRKIVEIPLVLVGRDYWLPVQNFIKEYLLEKHATIDREDLRLYTITDDVDEVVDIVLKAPKIRTPYLGEKYPAKL